MKEIRAMNIAGMAIAGGIVFATISLVIWVLYMLSKIKGANDVIATDNAATQAGTAKATAEVVKTVSNEDSEANLDKGAF